MVSDCPLRPLRLLCKKVPIARDVERGGEGSRRSSRSDGDGGWCTTVHVHARSTVHGQVARRMSFKRKGARQVGANRHSIGIGTSLNSYVILVQISTYNRAIPNRRTTPRTWSNRLSVKDTHCPCSEEQKAVKYANTLDKGHSFAASKVRATVPCDGSGARYCTFSDNGVGTKKGPRKIQL